MVNKKVTIAVDKKFFDNVFEKQRTNLQKQLGIMNLSQANFTKMIKGLKLKVNIESFKPPKKIRGRKKSDFFEI